MSEIERKCPICRSVLYVEQSVLSGTLCELHEKCSTGHYFYSYAYGHTEVVIGDQEFSIHYDAPYEETSKFNMEMNSAIKASRAKHAQNNKIE